jgi:hypothetical protein
MGPASQIHGVPILIYFSALTRGAKRIAGVSRARSDDPRRWISRHASMEGLWLADL